MDAYYSPGLPSDPRLTSSLFPLSNDPNPSDNRHLHRQKDDVVHAHCPPGPCAHCAAASCALQVCRRLDSKLPRPGQAVPQLLHLPHHISDHAQRLSARRPRRRSLILPGVCADRRRSPDDDPEAARRRCHLWWHARRRERRLQPGDS